MANPPGYLPVLCVSATVTLIQIAHVVSAAVFAYPALGQISRRLEHAAAGASVQVAHVVSAAVFAYPALGQISRRLDHAAATRGRIVFIDLAALRAVPLLLGVKVDGNVRIDHTGLIRTVGRNRRDRVFVKQAVAQIRVGSHIGSHADGTAEINRTKYETRDPYACPQQNLPHAFAKIGT